VVAHAVKGVDHGVLHTIVQNTSLNGGAYFGGHVKPRNEATEADIVRAARELYQQLG
jgi:hypothetical protein